MDENQKFQCNGDCLNCRAISERKVQWQYCSAQHTYNTMRMIEALQLSFVSMQGTVKELAEKIEAIQNSEAVAIDTAAIDTVATSPEIPRSPARDNNGITQSGDGVL